MAKSNEPLFWSLFSAGGVVAAFFIPVTLILTGVAVPAGWITENDLLLLVRHPLTRVYLFVLISLPLFHWGSPLPLRGGGFGSESSRCCAAHRLLRSGDPGNSRGRIRAGKALTVRGETPRSSENGAAPG